jgi:hypothetical protein
MKNKVSIPLSLLLMIAGTYAASAQAQTRSTGAIRLPQVTAQTTPAPRNPAPAYSPGTSSPAAPNGCWLQRGDGLPTQYICPGSASGTSTSGNTNNGAAPGSASSQSLCAEVLSGRLKVTGPLYCFGEGANPQALTPTGPPNAHLPQGYANSLSPGVLPSNLSGPGVAVDSFAIPTPLATDPETFRASGSDAVASSMDALINGSTAATPSNPAEGSGSSASEASSSYCNPGDGLGNTCTGNGQTSAPGAISGSAGDRPILNALNSVPTESSAIVAGNSDSTSAIAPANPVPGDTSNDDAPVHSQLDSAVDSALADGPSGSASPMPTPPASSETASDVSSPVPGPLPAPDPSLVYSGLNINPQLLKGGGEIVTSCLIIAAACAAGVPTGGAGTVAVIFAAQGAAGTFVAGTANIISGVSGDSSFGQQAQPITDALSNPVGQFTYIGTGDLNSAKNAANIADGIVTFGTLPDTQIAGHFGLSLFNANQAATSLQDATMSIQNALPSTPPTTSSSSPMPTPPPLSQSTSSGNNSPAPQPAPAPTPPQN